MARKTSSKKRNKKPQKRKPTAISKKLAQFHFPLQQRQKSNLKDASIILRKFANIKSHRQVDNLVQKGGGGWLTAALLIPELVRAIHYLIK